MAIWRSQHYRQNGLKQGVDPAVLDRAIRYGEAITASNRQLIPVFSLRHLAALSGVNYGALRAYVARNIDQAPPYRIFRIRKRTVQGEQPRLRTICVPLPDLRKVQRFIHDHILSHMQVHSASIAYGRKVRPHEEIAIHCRCRWLIKLDVKNFFEAIPEQAVYRIFRSAGYPALISFEMARLCTRIVPLNWEEGVLRHSTNRPSRYSIKTYSNWQQGSLAQGAPSSPVLANLCSRHLDEMITEIAEEFGMVYTRYADDIALSTVERGFSKAIAKKVIQRVYSAMRKCGLSPNTTKTKIAPPGGRKVILGLYVDQDTPRLMREFRSNVEQHLYFCRRPDVGPVAHARRKGFAAVLGFKNHLRGLIAYATQVDSTYGAKLSAEFRLIKWPF